MRSLLIKSSILFSGIMCLSQGYKLEKPELELNSIETELKNIGLRLEATRSITESGGFGPQQKLNEESFERAKRFFRAGHLNATVREFNNYLNAVQVPKIEPYLEAQVILGDSYKILGHKVKAFRAYSRYMASFLTINNPNFDEFIDVLKKSLPLIEVNSQSGAKEMAQVLSTINTFNVPEKYRSDIYYLSARAASKIGRPNLAIEWFKKAEELSSSKKSLAKTLYFKAMIHLAEKDYSLAEEDLKTIEKMDPSEAGEFKDISKLALARVNIHLKKSKKATAIYESITESSTQYKEARFELIYVLLDQNRFARARAIGEDFLQRFPSHASSYQIKTLLAYLQLRTEDYDQASSNIKTAQDQLSSIRESINSRLRNKKEISYEDTKYIIKRTSGEVGNPWIVNEADRLFARLEELKVELSNLEGDIKDSYYTLGRSSLAVIRPHWIERSKQLSKLAEKSLEVGHRLIALEKHYYDQHLSSVEKYELRASEKRRNLLSSAFAKSKRKLGHWREWANLMSLEASVVSGTEKLLDLKASIASMKAVLKTLPEHKRPARQLRISNAEIRMSVLQRELEKSLEIVRAFKVEKIFNQSELAETKAYFTKYSNLLYEEAMVVEKKRNKLSKPSERLLYRDIEHRWAYWKKTSLQVFEDITALENGIKKSLKDSLDELGVHSRYRLSLSDKQKDLSNKLSRHLGNSVSMVLSSYNNAISQREEKHRKWAADIEWLSTNEIKDQQRLNEEKYRIESQILDENLEDLNEGVNLRWNQQ